MSTAAAVINHGDGMVCSCEGMKGVGWQGAYRGSLPACSLISDASALVAVLLFEPQWYKVLRHPRDSNPHCEGINPPHLVIDSERDRKYLGIDVSSENNDNKMSPCCGWNARSSTSRR